LKIFVTFIEALEEGEEREKDGNDDKVYHYEKLVPPIRIKRTTNGLGKRCHDPTPAYSGSLRPTAAKVCAKLELWLEWAGMSWSEVELSTE